MERNSLRRWFRVGDFLAIAVVLTLAALLFFISIGGKKGDFAEISTAEGEIVVLPLREEREVQVTSRGHTLIVAVKDGEVCVKSADCRDQVCVGTGAVSKSGRSIVCAPAGVVVRVVKGGVSDADFVAG